jgi:hypothetical protein
MRFTKEALGILVVLATALPSTTAFAPTVNLQTHRQNSANGAAIVGTTSSSSLKKTKSKSNLGLSPFLSRSAARATTARKLAEQDDSDDEDSDDEDNDEPLAKGIDSVSWLPTVKGAKNVEITGAKEVS